MTTTRAHSDGGTYTTLKLADTTVDGWGIGLIRRVYYTGRVGYEVTRYNRRHFLTIARFATEAEARAKANAEWLAERAALPANRRAA